MANTNWNTRIILCNDETVNWGTSSKVLLKGEVGIELLESGEVKIKVGDGTKTFAQLKYATMTPNEINEAVKRAIQTASHSHANKAILDAITASFTTELKANYDKAYTHANSAHAPSNAERNTITVIKKNGAVVEPDESRAVNIAVPVKTSELTNDSGFVTKTHTHGNADITGLDASKLTGTIDIARLPHGALERCKVVTDDTARFKLTTADVQTGDTVKVTTTDKMYFVVDDSKLSTESGYEIYTAGSATSVPWSGVTGKPSTFTPSSHKHPMTDVNGLETALAGKATSAQGTKADTAVQSVKLGGVEKKVGTTVELPAYPTTLPASDVSAWAKAPQKPSYTKAEIGLGNVTNVRQIAGLSTGTTADHVVAFGADGYTVKDTGFTIGKSVPSNALFTDTTYAVANTSTAGLVKSATGANKVTVASDGTMNVGSVSTDIIANGANVLILNGGGAQ